MPSTHMRGTPKFNDRSQPQPLLQNLLPGQDSAAAGVAAGWRAATAAHTLHRIIAVLLGAGGAAAGKRIPVALAVIGDAGRSAARGGAAARSAAA